MDKTPQSAARSLQRAEFDRSVVRIVIALTSIAAVGLIVLAAASQRAVFLTQAAAAMFTAVVGLIQMMLKREHVYSLLLMAAAGIAVNVTLNGAAFTEPSSAVSLVVIGIGATLVVQKPRPHIMGYTVFLFISLWLWHADEPVVGVLEASVTAVVFSFGAAAIEWLRDRAHATEVGYAHLFMRAPVSLWREDFSRVHDWLVWLRSTGVTDLASYLNDQPERVGEAAQLIEVTEVNHAAIRLLEADGPDELIGPLDPRGMTPSTVSSLRDQLLTIWEDGTELVTEVHNGRTLKGRRLDGLLSFNVPTLGGKPDYSQVTVSIVDVTESRMAREQLEELVTSKNQLIAAVSHELRTPLTAVVGLAGELAESFDSFAPAEIAEFIRLIATQSEDVSLIVEDLLVAAQAESGLIPVRLEPTNVPDQITAALESVRFGDSVTVELPQPIGRAYVDPARMRQIVRNLVTNADRYGTPPIRVVIRSSDDDVVIEIRDRGEPLAPDQREYIFNRYHRAKERPGVAASVGVGLTVSRELARVMGGELTYDHDGETVFRLTLPKWGAAEGRLAG